MTKVVETVATPVGRLINHSLFEKDIYTDPAGRPGTPAYKIEMVFDDNEEIAELEEKVIAAAVEKWGPGAEQDYNDLKINSPFTDGDTKAAEREAKGKKGDAYKGKLIAKANSIFNKHGVNAPGGVAVFKQDISEVTFDEQGLIYNGCYGVAAVVIHAYPAVGNGLPGVKFYLSAFQKTAEGEKLMGERDYSQVFKPVAGAPSEGGRRRRAG